MTWVGIITPARDKGIFANAVFLIDPFVEIMKTEFRGIDDLERGITEVGFYDNLEPTAFRIPA